MELLKSVRAQVEERKLELEKLERKIFPPGQRATHQDSIPSSSEEQRLGDNGSSESQEVSDSPYVKLKQVTGNDHINETNFKCYTFNDSIIKTIYSYLINIVMKYCISYISCT